MGATSVASHPAAALELPAARGDEQHDGGAEERVEHEQPEEDAQRGRHERRVAREHLGRLLDERGGQLELAADAPEPQEREEAARHEHGRGGRVAQLRGSRGAQEPRERDHRHGHVHDRNGVAAERGEPGGPNRHEEEHHADRVVPARRHGAGVTVEEEEPKENEAREKSARRTSQRPLAAAKTGEPGRRYG